MAFCLTLNGKCCVFVAAVFCFCVLVSRGLKLPTMSMPEMRNLLRYTVWNLLTFSPHLRPLMVKNFTHVYRMHMLPDGSEYRIRTDSGTVDGLYRLEFGSDTIRSFGNDVRYKITFSAKAPTYYSAVAPYDPYHGAYLYKNQTTYFSRIVFSVYLNVDAMSGKGSLWYVDVSNVGLSYTKVGKNTQPELFSGLWFQSSIREIVTTSVFGYRTVRREFSKILNGRSYL